MSKKKKYRVKVVVRNNDDILLTSQKRKYVIQEKFVFGWFDYSTATIDKEWAYQTCIEMNTPYKEEGNIILRLHNAKDAKWVINSALSDIENIFKENSIRHIEMKKLHTDLINKINKQLYE